MVGRLPRRITLLLMLPILLIVRCALADDARIQLLSDTESIFLGDLVVVDVEASGLLDPLDVSPLLESAELLRETTGTRIAVVNGKVVEIALRRMEFLPRVEGTLILGPLSGSSSAGTVTSNSLAVRVLPPVDTDWQPDNSVLQAELKVSTSEPRIGELITLDIELRHRHPIADESIVLPDLTDFDVVPVFESRRTFDEQDADWRVIAWRYLLFAQHSGTVTIEPVSWTGTMIRSRTQRGEFTTDTAHASIAVAAASGNRDDWWLPAQSLQLSERWSQDVRELSAGDEAIRTLEIVATGVQSHQLPDMEPLPSRAISSQLIRADRSQTLIDGTLTATASFDFRMTAQSPIPVFLDTVRVPWWSTLARAEREAIIPARRINIGLPDRADLLTGLALREAGTRRWWLQLQSALQWQRLAVLLIACAMLGAVAAGCRPALRRLRSRQAQRRHQRILERLARQADWAELYTTLDPHRRYPGQQTCDRLRLVLEQQLFRDAGSGARVEASDIVGKEIVAMIPDLFRNDGTQPSEHRPLPMPMS